MACSEKKVMESATDPVFGQTGSAELTVSITDTVEGEPTNPPEEVESDMYRFYFLTEDNDTVAGVKLQICQNDACLMKSSDDAGLIEFDGEPQIYSIHVYSFPDEYELVSEREFETEAKYGVYKTILKKIRK